MKTNSITLDFLHDEEDVISGNKHSVQPPNQSPSLTNMKKLNTQSFDTACGCRGGAVGIRGWRQNMEVTATINIYLVYV